MNSNSDRRLLVLGVLAVVFLLFLGRLFYMQVIDDQYAKYAKNNAIKEEKIFPIRGFIFDRNGKLLVENTELHDLVVIPRMLKLLPADTAKLCALLAISDSTLRDRLASASKFSMYKASVLVDQLPDSVYVRIQERLWAYPGLKPVKRPIRKYPEAVAAHVLGYVGEVSEKTIDDSLGIYQPGDYRGFGGIESSYEFYLRGKRGVRYRIYDVMNRDVGSWQGGKYDAPAQSGQDMTLTLDLELQRMAEKLMNGKRGSVVAIEPATGDVLAYVSAPGYDPNLMVGPERGNNYMKLLKDRNKPLFNRPVMALYPPGSIFKLCQAAIGLEAGVLKENTTMVCGGGFTVGGGVRVRCAHGQNHGVPDLFTSISRSCNAYYCQNFRNLLIQRGSTRNGLALWATRVKSFGLGEKLGIDLPNELRGRVPTPEYFDKRYKGKNWRWQMLISLAIGQGEMGVTPLQMANYAAIFANGGWYKTPHLLKALGPDKLIPKKFTERHNTTPPPSAYPLIREAMAAVVERGTARSAYTPAFTICGKTGTAQNPHGEDHSIFVCFAPKDNPKIAIAVYVENGGSGATYAAPIASVMAEKYINDTLLPQRKAVADWIMAKRLIATPEEIEARKERLKAKTDSGKRGLRPEPILRDTSEILLQKRPVPESPGRRELPKPTPPPREAAMLPIGGGPNRNGQPSARIQGQ